MSIKGNFIGSAVPRTNYNQTDSTEPDYLNGKAELDEKINEAKEKALAALPKSGGTMTGTVTTKGIVLTAGVDYGDSLPATVTPGKLFFKKVT